MRTKYRIAATLTLVFSLACGFELYSAANHLFRTAPFKVSFAEIAIARQFRQEFSIGHHQQQETVTLASIQGKPILIIGAFNRQGWLFPSIKQDLYRSQVPKADPSLTVLKFYRLHPYISLVFSIVTVGFLMLVTAFIFVRCFFLQLRPARNGQTL